MLILFNKDPPVPAGTVTMTADSGLGYKAYNSEDQLHPDARVMYRETGTLEAQNFGFCLLPAK